MYMFFDTESTYYLAYRATTLVVYIVSTQKVWEIILSFSYIKVSLLTNVLASFFKIFVILKIILI